MSEPASTASEGGNRIDLARDLFFPTLLFTALGGMTWAVRGCSGFGAVPGCIFAGVTWGAAWWYIAREPGREPSRRYSSGWIVLALTLGIGLSGARGWMQWPAFFRGQLMTGKSMDEFVPISRSYGFLWLFLAGVPWAGLGACLLAWTGSLRQTRPWHWVLRIALGVGAGYAADQVFQAFPEYILPLYRSLQAEYQDAVAYPHLQRLRNDCHSALIHLGFFLGFWCFEVLRRDWKNVVLIATVGIVNGIGWALCQNWEWASRVWPNGHFNWWRCWESSGGLSIGIAYGIAYFLVNRRMRPQERAQFARNAVVRPDFEWLLVYLGLTALASVYLRSPNLAWRGPDLSVVMAVGTGYYLVRQFQAPAKSTAATIADSLVACLLTAVLIYGIYLQGLDERRGQNLYLAGTMAAGFAYSLVRFQFLGSYFAASPAKTEAQDNPADSDPSLDWFGLYLGLLPGLGLSVRNGLKGWFNIYYGDEAYWSRQLWSIFGPGLLVALIGVAAAFLFQALFVDRQKDTRNRLLRWIQSAFGAGGSSGLAVSYALVWLVLIVQNVIAQLVTGPLTSWTEFFFSVYYILLFLITAVIVHYYATIKAFDRILADLHRRENVSGFHSPNPHRPEEGASSHLPQTK